MAMIGHEYDDEDILIMTVQLDRNEMQMLVEHDEEYKEEFLDEVRNLVKAILDDVDEEE